MKTVELFSGTKSFSKVAASLGYSTLTIDNDPSLDPDWCVDILKFNGGGLPGRLIFFGHLLHARGSVSPSSVGTGIATLRRRQTAHGWRWISRRRLSISSTSSSRSIGASRILAGCSGRCRGWMNSSRSTEESGTP